MNNIMLIDDHDMLLFGLKAYIESNSDFKVIKTATTSQEALNFINNSPEKPDLVVFDIQLKEEMTFNLMKTFSENYPDIKIAVFSMFDTNGYVMLAKECGARGYISKASDNKKLLECMSRILQGEETFEIEARDRLTKLEQVSQILTKKEKRILEYILMDKNNSEIAEIMDIKTHTVEKYASTIYEKLGVSFREDILAKYK